MLERYEESQTSNTDIYHTIFDITHHDVHLQNLPSSLIGKKIVQISDLHRRHDIPDGILVSAVEYINAVQPDYVALTGDFINSSPRNIQPALNILSHIHIKGDVFAVMGNHDYPHGRGVLPEGMRKLGFQVLMNESVRIGNGLWFAGVDDLLKSTCEPEKALQGIPLNEPVIMLSHNPDIVKHIKSDHHMLVLSGHTHGGQYNLPILTPELICLIHLHTRLIHGWYRVRNMQLYVNRGIGVSGVWFLAKRYKCEPEITEYTLHP
jgi:predicted MPP superfamily phosphohydrolase